MCPIALLKGTKEERKKKGGRIPRIAPEVSGENLRPGGPFPVQGGNRWTRGKRGGGGKERKKEETKARLRAAL